MYTCTIHTYVLLGDTFGGYKSFPVTVLTSTYVTLVSLRACYFRLCQISCCTGSGCDMVGGPVVAVSLLMSLCKHRAIHSLCANMRSLCRWLELGGWWLGAVCVL